MNWIRENKKLATIVGIMITGAIGLGAYLYMSYSAFSTAKEEYNNVGSAVTSLQSAKIYPNEENNTLLGKKVSEYQDEVEKLRGVLLHLQQPFKPLSETEFQTRLKEKATAIRQKAEAAGLTLPADFALGFNEYTATLPKSASIAAELGVHLDVIDKIITTLIESGAKSLDSLERTKPEIEKGAPTLPVPASGKPVTAALNTTEPVMDRYPIKLSFTTDQAPLQNLMNVLSNPNPNVMPHFTVVRLLSIENEKNEGPLKSDIKVASEASGTVPATPTEVIAAKPDAVTIMGEELLKVYLEVDYMRFRDSAAKGANVTGGKK